MQMKYFDVTIKNKTELDNCYLPFIKHGGLFIATDELCQLRELVHITLKLFTQTEPMTWQSKVVFINPPYSNSKFPMGVGVALTEELGKIMCAKM